MTNFLLQNAQRLHQAGNLAEAARLYGEVLRIDPGQFEARYALGVLHYQAGRYAEAERLIADAIRLNARVPEAHYFRGCALQRLNRNEEAVSVFDQALLARPGFIDALMARCVTLMTLNRYEDGLADVDAIIAAEPENAGAWNNRGCMLQGMNRNEEALACFEKAVSLKPDFVEALISGGSVLAALKRFEDAAKNYEHALSINPDLPYVRGNLILYRLQCCDWRHLQRDRARIAADTDRVDYTDEQPPLKRLRCLAQCLVGRRAGNGFQRGASPGGEPFVGEQLGQLSNTLIGAINGEAFAGEGFLRLGLVGAEDGDQLLLIFW